MSSSIFSDRFLRENPILTPDKVNSMSESELLASSSELKRMVDSVKRVDSTLARAKAKDIFFVITDYADPRIGGVLAAAIDKSTGNRLFDSIDEVKQIMFPPEGGNENLQLTIFNDTVRQSSVTLTASRLVGNLAAAGQNFRGQAEYLANSAIKDIERITENIDVEQIRQEQGIVQNNEEVQRASIFFERTSFNLESPLDVYVYVSGSTSSWDKVGTFEGLTSTADIVSKIGDFINSLTLGENSANLIAAPSLSGESSTHSIYFEARRYSTEFSAEVISIKFDSLKVPFNWGIRKNELSSYQINSLIVATNMGKIGSEDTSSATPLISHKEGKPSVLYIRNKQDVTIKQQEKYIFKISPLIEKEMVVPFGRFTSNDQEEQESLDRQRPSQFALSLTKKLHEIKSDSKCLGAIIKNDPVDSNSRPTVGIELIGYEVAVKDVWIVLDLIKIPKDLEVAVGDLRQPLTNFSNEPRSIRVENTYLSNTDPSDVNELESFDSPKLLSRPPSSYLNRIRNKMDEWHEMDNFTRRHYPPRYR